MKGVGTVDENRHEMRDEHACEETAVSPCDFPQLSATPGVENVYERAPAINWQT